MKALSHPGHFNFGVFSRKQLKFLFVWRCFASHSKGFFSSEGQRRKQRYLIQSGWRQSPKMGTWLKGHMSPGVNHSRVFAPHPKSGHNETGPRRFPQAQRENQRNWHTWRQWSTHVATQSGPLSNCQKAPQRTTRGRLLKTEERGHPVCGRSIGKIQKNLPRTKNSS